MSKKHLLIICRKAPYGNSLSREAVDIALAAAVFDQDISLLFTGDGVLQLLNDQNPITIEQKSQEKLLSALAMYDINNVYADDEALAARSIDIATLPAQPTTLNQKDIAALLLKADITLNF